MCILYMLYVYTIYIYVSTVYIYIYHIKDVLVARHGSTSWLLQCGTDYLWHQICLLNCLYLHLGGFGCCGHCGNFLIDRASPQSKKSYIVNWWRLLEHVTNKKDWLNPFGFPWNMGHTLFKIDPVEKVKNFMPLRLGIRWLSTSGQVPGQLFVSDFQLIIRNAQKLSQHLQTAPAGFTAMQPVWGCGIRNGLDPLLPPSTLHNVLGS